MTTWQILTGDVREMLRGLPDQSVQTCVTSPPYFGLRDYGHAGQLGLEKSPKAYVASMVAVFADVRRILKKDGVLWVNIGDSYAASGRGGNPEDSQHQKQRTNRGSVLPAGMHEGARQAGVVGRAWCKPPDGYKQKDLIGIPWMVAFALRADGWYLRSDIIWSKPNPMPESVTDRPTKAHEYIFLLSKSKSYFYDAAAIREPYAPSTVREFQNEYTGQGTKDYKAAGVQNPSDLKRRMVDKQRGHGRRHAGFNDRWDGMERSEQIATGANKRSVWNVATHPYPEAHFATYPEKLIEPCILAGSREGDTVLDPFTGSGTTGAVSVRLQRNFVGCELNPAYVQLARTRIGNVAPLLAEEVA